MKITKTDALLLANKHKINLDVYSISSIHYGLNVELEHKDITKGNMEKTLKIVMAHLKESPKYYRELKKMEQKLKSMK
jgi:hypothetical protein